jgi:hypothetical protein
VNARRLGWVRTVRFALAVAMLGVMVGAAEFFYECPGFEEYAIVGQTTPAAVAAPAAQQR